MEILNKEVVEATRKKFDEEMEEKVRSLKRLVEMVFHKWQY